MQHDIFSTCDGSLRLLERSLELLKTDHIDLWQIHALSRMDQVEEVFAPGGALEARSEPVHKQALFYRRWES